MFVLWEPCEVPALGESIPESLGESNFRTLWWSVWSDHGAVADYDSRDLESISEDGDHGAISDDGDDASFT